MTSTYSTYSDISIRRGVCGWAFYVLRGRSVVATDSGRWHDINSPTLGELTAICEALRRVRGQGHSVIAYSDVAVAPKLFAGAQVIEGLQGVVERLQREGNRLDLRVEYLPPGNRGTFYQACHRQSRRVALGARKHRSNRAARDPQQGGGWRLDEC